MPKNERIEQLKEKIKTIDDSKLKAKIEKDLKQKEQKSVTK